MAAIQWIQTFKPLLASRKYFGEDGLSKLINVHPDLRLHSLDQWTLSGAAVFYPSRSLRDGIYDRDCGLVLSSEKPQSRFFRNPG
jgi:hypothetical protein